MKRISFDKLYIAVVDPSLPVNQSKIIRYLHYRIRDVAPKRAFVSLHELKRGRQDIDVGTQLSEDVVLKTLDELKELEYIELEETDYVNRWKVKIVWANLYSHFSDRLNKFELGRENLKRRDFVPSRFYVSLLNEHYPNNKIRFGPIERSILNRMCRKVGESEYKKMVTAYISKFDQIGGIRSNWKNKVSEPDVKQFSYMFEKKGFDLSSIKFSSVARQSNFEGKKGLA